MDYQEVFYVSLVSILGFMSVAVIKANVSISAINKSLQWGHERMRELTESCHKREEDIKDHEKRITTIEVKKDKQ